MITQEHFLEVVGGQEFLLLPLEEMERLLTSDDVNVPDEETVVSSLLTWVGHDAAARERHLPQLLSHVRLPLLQPQVSRLRPRAAERLTTSTNPSTLVNDGVREVVLGLSWRAASLSIFPGFST